MPWITNVSRRDVETGNHPLTGGGVLIRIGDKGLRFTEVARSDDFGVVCKLSFDDIDYGPNSISSEQSTIIASLLDLAKKNGHNVIVHCTAGICRSGAVVEAAVAYGFDDIHKRYRQPNVRVKKGVMYALGLGYEGIEND